MRRYRRTVNVTTFVTLFLTTVVTLFTPPTYQATTLISLPAGVSADQVAVHLQTYALEVVPPGSHPLKDFRWFVKPVGNDSPTVAALVVEGEYNEDVAVVADDWATISVRKLGGQAAILTHAQEPHTAIRPKKAQNELIGLIGGFLLGLLIAGLKESSKQRGAPVPAEP